MIYILIFLLLYIFSFWYDIAGRRQYSSFVFNILLIVLALVSGLRYRLGADTIVYEYWYRRIPDFYHLKWDTVFDSVYEPMWIVLNSLSKTIYPEFFLLQSFVSFFHIFVWGIFVKMYFPAVKYLALLFFYMFEFTHMDMVLMREAVAIGFMLLALIALEKKKYIKVTIAVLGGFMFHHFSVFVFFLIFLYHKLFSKYIIASYIIVISAIILFLVNDNWLQDRLVSFFLGSDTLFTQKAIYYLSGDQYNTSNLNWKGMIGIYISALLYCVILYKIPRNGKKLIKMDISLFRSIIIVAIIILIVKSSFFIIYRFYDYFQTFTSLLVIVYFCDRIKNFPLQRKFVFYIFVMFVPIMYCYKIYTGPWIGNPSPNVCEYMEFYPYSSVLNPVKDPVRERSINAYAFD